MKKIVTTPFNRYKIPPRQNLFFMPIIWGASWLMTREGHLKIRRNRVKGLKPPFIVVATHQAFMDFFVTPLVLFPRRANYVSELETFEKYGEWLYRQVGCLGTRKFAVDTALVKNIKRVMARGGVLVLYPEARYANVGTSSRLPDSVGKLAKHLDVPVVTLSMRGNYLQSPIWNLKKRSGIPLEATISQLFTCAELRDTSLSDVNRKLREALSYDEYAWQYENKIEIDEPFRAEGLELVLYKCPNCGTEHQMHTSGAELYCKACTSKWTMNVYGKLENGEYERFSHIPDWYEWQRSEVHRDIVEGRYRFEQRVRIESLPNAKNFIDLGEGVLLHDAEGFRLTFRDYGEAEEKTLHFTPKATYSIHTEYDYRKKGQCFTLSTQDNTYFIYPTAPGFSVTKLQLAAEELHQIATLQKSAI